MGAEQDDPESLRELSSERFTERISANIEEIVDLPVICFLGAGPITGEREEMAISPVINQLDFSVNVGPQTNWLDSKKNLSEGVLEFVKNRRILFRFHCDD